MNRNPNPPSELFERQWIFSWRKRTKPVGLMVLPIALTAVAFALLLAVVQVRVANPQFEMERQGSLVYLPTTGDGEAWAIRAKESGPQLSRFEPTHWDGYPAVEQSIVATTQLPTLPHLPRLHEFPAENALRPPTLAAVGVPILPKPIAPPTPIPPPVAQRMEPVLYPLFPGGTDELPQQLPPIPTPLDPKVLEADWRSLVFLVRLNPSGGVTDCVALNKIPGPGPAQLESWLRGISFDPKLGAADGWLALGVRFINRPIHGSNDH